MALCLSVLFNKARWLLPIVASHLRGKLAQFDLRRISQLSQQLSKRVNASR